ncbi:MAG: PKD domain-containing protein, partial [Candidatus Kariarchaeaceae archaeon]
MVATSTRQRGTAGAFAVIAILLTTMVYNDLSGNFRPLGDIEDDAVYVKDNNVYVGQEVVFYLRPVLLSEDYGIDFFMWDFHDGDYIYVSTREDKSISHVYNTPGEFMVSVMALKGNQSKIFTIPIYVIPAPHDITIKVSSIFVTEDRGSAQILPPLKEADPTKEPPSKQEPVEEEKPSEKEKPAEEEPLALEEYGEFTLFEGEKIPMVLEDTTVVFEASGSQSYTPILNYLWEFGDGETKFGQKVNHSYVEAGDYTVRVRGYTNSSLIYTGFQEITILNKVPEVEMIASSNIVDEDSVVTFTAGVIDSLSDLDTLQYVWDFGDGLMAKGSPVSHIYTQDGTYEVVLTVKDNNGATANISRDIQVNNKVPIINDLWSYRNYYTEGETVTIFSNLTDSQS